jgi:hypothetical protein
LVNVSNRYATALNVASTARRLGGSGKTCWKDGELCTEEGGDAAGLVRGGDVGGGGLGATPGVISKPALTPPQPAPPPVPPSLLLSPPPPPLTIPPPPSPQPPPGEVREVILDADMITHKLLHPRPPPSQESILGHWDDDCQWRWAKGVRPSDVAEAVTLLGGEWIVGMGSSTDRRVLIALAEKLGVNNETINTALHDGKAGDGSSDEFEDFSHGQQSRRLGSWAAVIDTTTAGLPRDCDCSSLHIAIAHHCTSKQV